MNDFDYLDLPALDRKAVLQRTNEIKGLVRKSAESIREIGVRLQEVRLRVSHGRFLPWLKLEFPDWSYATANRFMLVAEQFKNCNLQNLAISASAVYLLAGPSVPEPARQEALGRAAGGEAITYGTAQGIVDTHRGKTTPKVAEALSCLTAEEQLSVINSAEATALAEDDEATLAKPARKEVSAHWKTCPTCKGSGRVPAPKSPVGK